MTGTVVDASSSRAARSGFVDVEVGDGQGTEGCVGEFAIVRSGYSGNVVPPDVDTERLRLRSIHLDDQSKRTIGDQLRLAP